MSAHLAPGPPWWLPLFIAGTSLLASAYVGFNHNDKAIAIDIATLKAERVGDNARLDRIEHKVDAGMTKLEEIAATLKWSLGTPHGPTPR